jgi:hypothetical protein
MYPKDRELPPPDIECPVRASDPCTLSTSGTDLQPRRYPMGKALEALKIYKLETAVDMGYQFWSESSQITSTLSFSVQPITSLSA